MKFQKIRLGLISGAVCAWALVLLGESWFLGWGSWDRPGPGFFPAGLGGGLLLCGVGLSLSAAACAGEERSQGFASVRATGLGLLCFAGVAPLCGWVPAMVGCIVATSWGDRRWRWPHRWGYAVGCGLLGWLVFEAGLGVPWPAWRRPW